MSNEWNSIRNEISGWRGILSGFLCAVCALGGTNALGEDARVEHATHHDCPNLTGTYKLLGDALPGMPLNFRWERNELALDKMLGLDLNVPERRPTSDIEVVHTDTHTLSVKIVGSTVSKTMQLQPTDKVFCKNHRLTIESLVETKGEATRGQALIIDQLELAQDGALIVQTEIRGRGRFLYFFSLEHPPESYGARFQSVR